MPADFFLVTDKIMLENPHIKDAEQALKKDHQKCMCPAVKTAGHILF
jgi:hypothetical protein